MKKTTTPPLPCPFCGKRKKQETTYFAGDALRILGKAMTVFQLHRKPPDENASGGKFDQTVDAERSQADAMGNDACTDSDGALDGHPCDSEPFETESLRDKWRSLAIRWQSRCRCSGATIRHQTKKTWRSGKGKGVFATWRKGPFMKHGGGFLTKASGRARNTRYLRRLGGNFETYVGFAPIISTNC